MPRTARPSIATHYLRYTFGNVLIMVAGFVSFPIMTRLLDNNEYGIFGYYDSWLLILAAVFKLGGQHSIVRFYPHRGGAGALERFGASHVLLPFLCSLLLWLLAAIAFALQSGFHGSTEVLAGWVAVALLLPTMWNSFASGVFYAEERSALNVTIDVSTRWLQVVAILGVVYFVQRNAVGVYVARLMVALAMAVFLVYWLRRHLPMRWRDRDYREWFAGVRYGVPMMANELSANLLAFVDRLMLRYLLRDFSAVGIYSIGYGLALNISNMLHGALVAAYTQVSIRQYETEGAEAVVRTKRAVLRILVYVIAAMLVGLLAVGRDALLLLAGHDKYKSAPVFVWIGINYLLNGVLGICTSGLELHKRSATIFGITLMAAMVNILINLFWIPRYGVMGAVYATFVSYFVLNVARYATCPRELRVLPPLWPTALACGLGVMTWLVAHASDIFGFTGHLQRLLVMMAWVLVGFVLPVLACDRMLRSTLHGYVRARLPWIGHGH